MKRTITIAASAVGLVAITGCAEAIDSGDIKTSGMWADFVASADDADETTITTTLRTGGPDSNTYVELGPKDTLTYHVDGETYSPNKSEAPGSKRVQYVATVPKNKDDMAMRAELKREESEEGESSKDAPDSTATLPKTFAIESPEKDASLKRSEALTVELSSTDSDGETVAEISGDCLDELYEKNFEGNSVTFEAGTLQKEPDEESGEEVPNTCDAEVTVTRTRAGSVDDAYEGGNFKALQMRRVSFETRP